MSTTEDGAQVEAEIQGKPRSFRTRAVIFSAPGLACPRFVRTPAGHARDAFADAIFANRKRGGGTFKPPNTPYAGYAFTQDVVPGAEIEMEHLRAPNRCPEGTGMASVFLWNTPEKLRLDAEDESLKQQAAAIVEQNFPECRGKFFSSI